MKQKTRSMPLQKLVLTALFAALTAVGAFIKIPTPWSAFTLQVFFVFMAGALLGPKYGCLSQVVYVGLGLVGLPIFTAGGGLGYVFQTTFGFLLSYIPAAAVVGLICHRKEDDVPSARRIVLACIAGLAVIYAVGMPYMGLIINVYLGKGKSLWYLLWAGMIPYLPFDALKIAVTAILAKPLIPALQKVSASHRPTFS
jgi:biotin transport system substrate-specific component